MKRVTKSKPGITTDQTKEADVEAFINKLPTEKRTIINNQITTLTSGFKKTNPLLIGQSLVAVRAAFGVHKNDRISTAARMLARFFKSEVYRFGFTQPSIFRYSSAWEVAKEKYPEPLLLEMASRLTGQAVSKEKPFGRFTDAVDAAIADKFELADPTKFADHVVSLKAPRKEAKKTTPSVVKQNAYNAVMGAIRRLHSLNDKTTDINQEEAHDYLLEIVQTCFAGVGFVSGDDEVIPLHQLPRGYEPLVSDKQGGTKAVKRISQAALRNAA